MPSFHVQMKTRGLHDRTPGTCNSILVQEIEGYKLHAFTHAPRTRAIQYTCSSVQIQAKHMNYQLQVYVRLRCEKKAIIKLPKD